MTNGHSSYDDLARERRDISEYRAGYAEAQRAFLIGDDQPPGRGTGCSASDQSSAACSVLDCLGSVEAHNRDHT